MIFDRVFMPYFVYNKDDNDVKSALSYFESQCFDFLLFEAM